jgi:integrase/recombinase XerD
LPSARWSLGKEINAYLQELKDLGRLERTLKDYRYIIEYSFQGLEDEGLNLNPRKVDQSDIDHLYYQWYGGEWRYRDHNIKVLKLFLRWTGNPRVDKLRTGYKDNGLVRNIRWLTDEQAYSVRENALGIEKILVHLELDLAMRRIEVIRCKVSDFKTRRNGENELLIDGKGHKWRRVNWDPDTDVILNEWLQQRQGIVEQARMKNPEAKDPGNLLIHGRAGKIQGHRKTAIDDVLKSLGERLGFHFSNHDLRRTCGRQMHRAGVPIEDIANIFGHRDTKTTLHYLGLDQDDMSLAMKKYAQYRKTCIFPKMEKNEGSQCFSGPNGI